MELTLAAQDYSAPEVEAALVAAVAADPDLYWTVLKYLPLHPEAAFTAHVDGWNTVSAAIQAGVAVPHVSGLNGTSPAADPDGAARQLSELHQRRLLAAVCQEGLRSVETGAPPEEIVTRIEEGAAAARQAVAGHRLGNVNWGDDLLGHVVKEADSAVAARASGMRTLGLPTGLPGLDRVINGLMPGGVYVLGGPPSTGKTSLALQWACHIAQTAGVPTVFVTFENTPKNLVLKAVSRLSGISATAVEQGRIDPQKWSAGVQAFSAISPLLAFVHGDAGTTMDTIEERVRETLNRHGTDQCLIVVDYLQRMAFLERYETIGESISLLMLRLHDMAARLQCPVMPLSSLASGTGDGEKITLSSLSRRGDLEYAADVVLLLGPRVETAMASIMRAKEVPGMRLLDLLIAKNRYGEAARAIPLMFRANLGDFAEESAT